MAAVTISGYSPIAFYIDDAPVRVDQGDPAIGHEDHGGYVYSQIVRSIRPGVD